MQILTKPGIAYFFGDYSAGTSIAGSATITSSPVDTNYIDPVRASISLVITGSTAGNITVKTSANGVTNWAETYSTTYSAAGTVNIPAATALNGYGGFFEIEIEETSTTSGTVVGTLQGLSL